MAKKRSSNPRRAGVARASVRAADRTCVAQRTGPETVRTRARAGGLLVAAPRDVYSPRFHEARSSVLDEVEAAAATALAGASHARRCHQAAAVLGGAPGGHLHLWGGYTSVTESLLITRPAAVMLLGQRRSAWSRRIAALHAAAAEQPLCSALAPALAWIAQVQLRH